MKFLYILVLLPLISFGQDTYHHSKISKSTLKVVKEIKKFPFLSLHTIETKAPVTGDGYFKDLYDTATPQELIALTNHPDSKVRCYAFSCVAITNPDTIFSIIKSHLNDDEIVRTQAIYYIPERGAEGHRDAIMVGDYYIQVATDTFRKQPLLTNSQMHELDSLIIHSKTDLKYRKEVANRFLKSFDAKQLRSNIKTVDTTDVAVISITKVSALYRGIINLIKIAVPGSKSFKATALGTLQKEDNAGNYTWNVTNISGTKAVIKIDAQMQDGSTIHEEKEYSLLSLNHVKTVVDDKNYIVCNLELTKEELINATIGLKVDDCYINNGKIPIDGFTILLSKKYFLSVEGNTFDNETIRKIKNLRKNTVLTIHADTEYDLFPTPVTVTLID